jgi:hypothetical protein
MRTKQQLLSIVLFCAFTASTPCVYSEAAEAVLPKPEEAFKDAKIGRTYKDSKPGTIALAKAPAGARTF